MRDSRSPWVVFRDFNGILYPNKKCGSLPKGEWDIEDFHNALSDCGLVGLGCSCGSFR